MLDQLKGQPEWVNIVLNVNPQTWQSFVKIKALDIGISDSEALPYSMTLFCQNPSAFAILEIISLSYHQLKDL